MSTPFDIPLSPTPQVFTIQLVNTFYQLTVQWNRAAQAWVLDIADVNGIPILSGVALVTGVNLLEQFAYLVLGGQLIVQTDHDTFAVPTYANLGSTGHLYYVVPG